MERPDNKAAESDVTAVSANTSGVGSIVQASPPSDPEMEKLASLLAVESAKPTRCLVEVVDHEQALKHVLSDDALAARQRRIGHMRGAVGRTGVVGWGLA